MSKKTTSNAFQQSAAQPPGQAPPKRVKVTLACVVCRKKKVKCDGIQPSCSRCNSMGLACEYSDPPRKRGPPKGYIEIIENRAHRIESLLSKDRSNVWEPAAPQQPGTDRTTSSSTILADEHRSVNSLMAPPSNILLDIVSNAVAVTAAVQNETSDYMSLNTPGSRDRDYCLFLAKEQEWVDSFFAHFNLFFPILSRQHFLHSLQYNPEELDPLLYNAVLALGQRYADDQSHENAGWHYYKRCQQILNTSSHDDNNITLSKIQALVIMCWYTFVAGDMQDCRTLRQRLAGAIMDLQLYRDPDSSQGIIITELRRRAFWVAYVVIQWLTCCIGDPVLSLSQDTMWDVKWPQLEDSQLQAIDSRKLLHQQSVPMDYALQVTSFAEMIRLATIVDGYFRGSSTVNSALTNWFLNLPSYLEYGKPADDSPPSPITRIYHMLYYTVQIMLHRTSDNFGVCGTAANTIIYIAEQMTQYNQEKYLINTFPLSLTLAVSVHLDHALRHDMPARINLGKSIRLLKETNSTMLSRSALSTALDSFVSQKCGIELDNQTEMQSRVNNKRRREDEEEQVDLNDLLGLETVWSNDYYDNWLSDLVGLPAQPVIITTTSAQDTPTGSSFSGSLSSPNSATYSPALSCDNPPLSISFSSSPSKDESPNEQHQQLFQQQYFAAEPCFGSSLPPTIDIYALTMSQDFIGLESYFMG